MTSTVWKRLIAETSERLLLSCGGVSAAGYVATDVAASALYPGYSVRDQAVSELFAIGAPTSYLAVPLFSLCSVLLLGFAAGVWRAAHGRRLIRALAVMFGCSAVIGLMLWSVYPMHMRGAERSSTDTMHLILATNPFVLLSLLVAGAAFRGRFRLYSAVTVAVMVIPAIAAFSYAPAVDANLPTPWLGATERVAQYGYEAWQAVLAVMLVRRHAAPDRPEALV